MKQKTRFKILEISGIGPWIGDLSETVQKKPYRLISACDMSLLVKSHFQKMSRALRFFNKIRICQVSEKKCFFQNSYYEVVFRWYLNKISEMLQTEVIMNYLQKIVKMPHTSLIEPP